MYYFKINKLNISMTLLALYIALINVLSVSFYHIINIYNAPSTVFTNINFGVAYVFKLF